MKGNKKLLVMVFLMTIILLNGTACTKDTADISKASGDQAVCSVCGEALEPGTFGAEGCYRDPFGRYFTRQEAGRHFVSFTTADHSNMPPLPEEERKACPDCGAVLEPGTFGEEGCYRTKSGFYLTGDQYRRMLLGCSDMNIDENTPAAIMGYDHPDYCVEESELMGRLFNDYYTPTQEDYVHNKPVSEKMTAEKVKEFAEDEFRNSSQSLTDFKLYRICYDKKTDMWMAEFYSYRDSEYTVVSLHNEYLLIFIDGTGVTRDMYIPEDNYTLFDDITNEKKPPIGEVGTFSYEDVHKTEGFVHKGEKEEVSMETLADYADEELKNSAYVSWLDETHVTKLAKMRGKDIYRVSYYWEGKTFQNIHVYLTKNGETKSMYVHEE